MSGTTTPQSFSDNFWSESSQAKRAFVDKRKDELKDFLFSVDDTPDFHDPYSDLSLFLSQKIKKEMFGSKNKKWSLKLQEDLLAKITPEFQKKFPQYRLGVSALKKTWEKISYFSDALYSKKEAITEEGKLNISFFIKENLKQLFSYRPSPFLPAYHYAHQLAVKMSECIALIDGTRPKLDQLTKTVWAVQRHLMLQQDHEGKNPYEEYDKVDKLIVKEILEITAKEPQITQSELEYQVKENLFTIRDIPNFASLDKITCNISSLLAEKLYPLSSFHTSFLSEQKKAIYNFIKRQIQLYKNSYSFNSSSDLVRRIIALYMLASSLPKNLSSEEILSAIEATYPVLQKDRPELPQALYAFIAAESVLMKNEQFCHAPHYVKQAISEAYLETKLLPELKGKETEILEIAIWKTLNESDELLEKLPYKLGQKIEEEIANILVENPNQSFSSVVSLTLKSFKKIKEVLIEKNSSEMERKIHSWTIQGDMLCRFLRLNLDSPLLKMILEMWQEDESHELFVSSVLQAYLKKHPQLTAYTPQIVLKVGILYKFAWYALKRTKEETSFDRFLKWHIVNLSRFSLSQEQLLLQLEEICKQSIPLIPFDRSHIQELIPQQAKTG